ncbi:interleukin-13 receptor subunit alpha-1-like [Epinephelus lanceolatus]|uniref:uncharacterized protein LOC117246476 n=1 Tax=Epinephelus lanceolatus TaxID=310571 RepID=UPI00144512DB|nr:uncharacterized protein LOC117246476 [Epinephelus lanceolatus]
MARKFQSLALVVLSFLSVTAEAQQGQILQLQNVSLQWINDFQTQVSWAPVGNCSYYGYLKSSRQSNIANPWQKYVVMEGGSLQLTVEATCNGSRTYKATINRTYPDLVRDLQCYLYAENKTRCSWNPVSPHVPDFKFFYRLINEAFTASADLKPSFDVKECSLYHFNAEGVKTGCDLDAGIHNNIDISFNGTLNNMLARNTFKIKLIDNVRHPALKWTVTKTGNKFNMRWTPPVIRGLNWMFELKYTKCNETQTHEIKGGETSFELHADPNCPYSMAIRAVAKTNSDNRRKIPWSEEKHFGADTVPNGWLYAAIIIPVMFGVLAVLMFVCFKKNKENIFPKVPEPRDLLTDISDNNNKYNVHNLYIQAEEEETCKITLLVDPLNRKPDF